MDDYWDKDEPDGYDFLVSKEVVAEENQSRSEDEDDLAYLETLGFEPTDTVRYVDVDDCTLSN